MMALFLSKGEKEEKNPADKRGEQGLVSFSLSLSSRPLSLTHSFSLLFGVNNSKLPCSKLELEKEEGSEIQARKALNSPSSQGRNISDVRIYSRHVDNIYILFKQELHHRRGRRGF